VSNIVIDKAEWEQFLNDSEQLADRYEKLLSKIKELQLTNSHLEKKLNTSQMQIMELQQKISTLEHQMNVDQKGLSAVKELHSTVTRLLKETETVV